MIHLKVILVFLLVPFLTFFNLAEEDVSVSDLDEGSWKTIQAPFNYQNKQVPRELWETIKEVLRKDKVSESVIENFSVLPINVNVQVFTENSGVLKDGLNYSLGYIEGGGDVDLFNFVAGKGGFKMRLVPEFPDEGEFHILYISDSEGKTVGIDPWGNGCGKIFDLSSNRELFSETGIQLTSARRHYMHLMAGTFIFFRLVEERLFLGYIRLEDSRYPNFKCSET